MVKIQTYTERDELNERNDCTVRAVAAVCDAPYLEAHALLKSHGRRDGRGFRFIPFMSNTTELFGRKVTRVIFGQTISGYSRPTRPTLAAFLRQYKTGRYIILKSGHAFAVVDGVVLDRSDPGSRSRVQYAYRIEKPEVDLEDEARRRELRLRIEALERSWA